MLESTFFTDSPRDFGCRLKRFFRGFFKKAYRHLHATVVKDCLLPFFFSERRVRDASENSVVRSEVLNSPLPERRLEAKNFSPTDRIWFHAASVGELESLYPLILLTAQNGTELVITILSESAAGPLANLRKTILENQATLLFAGYSPWEGEWTEALEKWAPSLFVTAKYEAWPDLWMSLQEQTIPLVIVAARARRSLRVARWLCRFLSGGLPRLVLFPCNESDASGLRNLFPQAWIQAVGEPRWDRVHSRSQLGNPRTRELIEIYQELKRPWGVVGSAWLEDLEFLESIFKKISGSLWIVPHRIDPENLQRIEKLLISKGLVPVRSSHEVMDLQELNRLEPSCVIVDEMGFLSELYGLADWAFIGGGFGAGIHSTIEPAIHGIPIAAGPHGTEKFSEVEELSSTGQLQILRSQGELLNWIESLKSILGVKKEDWIQDAKLRLGATQKIVSALENLRGPC